jgi:hypothetical protein
MAARSKGDVEIVFEERVARKAVGDVALMPTFPS